VCDCVSAQVYISNCKVERGKLSEIGWVGSKASDVPDFLVEADQEQRDDVRRRMVRAVGDVDFCVCVMVEW
jgi:hypothetical protein